MTNLSFYIEFLETVLYIALPVFVLTTFYLISVVKKHNYKLIQKSITNPILPNIDLGFFKKLQEEYVLIKKNKIPALINKISFYSITLGFIVLLLLVVIQEMNRYQ